MSLGEIMVHLMPSKSFHRWFKEIGHVFLILILSIGFSIFTGEFAFLRGWESLYRGLLRFFRMTLFLCLPPLSITTHLWQPRICYPEKKRDIYSNKAEASTRNSSHKTLAFPAISRDWHWTSFCHKAAWSSSDRYGINSDGLHSLTSRAISAGKAIGCHRDHDSCLPPLVHPLDHG
jgi:hypothetical protein